MMPDPEFGIDIDNIANTQGSGVAIARVELLDSAATDI
jgi:hypothetical protein